MLWPGSSSASSPSAPPVSGTARRHELPATPDTCYWGYLDASVEPVLTVAPGDSVAVEALTHHSGDAPDLLMDEGVRAVWDAIDEVDRGPGVHIMTGPVAIEGASPGDAVVVEIGSMRPRMPYGSNCAANWGLLYERFGKERITIYELVGDGDRSEFGELARPCFGFDFTARELYDVPGVISEPDAAARVPFGVPVEVPVRPHFGVLGVAPNTTERLSSIPPGRFGGNVDNWRFGPGARVYYPVFWDGGLVYVGDPHFAQGDGEICGTAIEASLDAEIRLDVAKGCPITAPVLETDEIWQLHGFGDDLDEAMAMAADQALWLLIDRFGLTADDAYSLCSVAVDFGVTQVVDGTVGCHATIARSILEG